MRLADRIANSGWVRQYVDDGWVSPETFDERLRAEDDARFALGVIGRAPSGWKADDLFVEKYTSALAGCLSAIRAKRMFELDILAGLYIAGASRARQNALRRMLRLASREAKMISSALALLRPHAERIERDLTERAQRLRAAL